MKIMPAMTFQVVTLAIVPREKRSTLIELAAEISIHNDLLVLDGGNWFDAYQLAREIRRRTADVDATLKRIRVARAFTCHQMVALLGQTTKVSSPIIILDMLATFYDDTVNDAESRMLLRQCVKHLNRLRVHAPIVVCVHPPPLENLDRPWLINALREYADNVVDGVGDVAQPALTAPLL